MEGGGRSGMELYKNSHYSLKKGVSAYMND